MKVIIVTLLRQKEFLGLTENISSVFAEKPIFLKVAVWACVILLVISKYFSYLRCTKNSSSKKFF